MSNKPPAKRKNSTRDSSISPPQVKRKIESTTTKKAVNNFFTPVSQKTPDRTTWRIVENSLLIARYNAGGPPGLKSGQKRRVAGFDLDHTIIKSKSGNRFAKDAGDWQWWAPSVPGMLKSLFAEGHLVTIFSNQGGISLKSDPKTVKTDQKRLSDFKSKVNTVLGQLDIPITLYAATARDRFRKPRTGMWEEMLEDYDLDVNDAIDMEGSIFVGDAGGRPAGTGTVKDHSCSDRDFAANLGILFHTPEEFFLQEDAKPFTRTFDPAEYLKEMAGSSTEGTPLVFSKKDPLELVVFCGSPGAGKSTFFWTHLKPLGYERVNQDNLKTRDRCIQVATEHLSEGKSVTVDNTNADPETRAKWVQLGTKFEIPVRCIYFTAPAKVCEHNDAVRALNLDLMNPEKRTMLPKVAFTGFASRFRPPSLEEGFKDIVRVDFQFEGSDEQRQLWSRYWI